MQPPDPLSAAGSALPHALLVAVVEAVDSHIGRTPLPEYMSQELELPPADPADVAMAIAYTNLMLEDPEAVTQQHLKMLRNRFSVEQIHELNRLIKERTGV